MVTGTGKKTLKYGVNTFNIVVKAEAGNTKTYIIKVNKEDTRNNDSSLNSLTISNTNIKFNRNTKSYVATVGNDITSVDIKASASNTKAKLTGIGFKNLKDGRNVFNVVITAENETKTTYEIIIIRAPKPGEQTDLSSNNKLKDLSIENIPFEFNSNKLQYNIDVDNIVEEINLKYEPEDLKAIITVNGDTNLKIGLNEIKVIVTAENGEVKIYSMDITRKDLANDKYKEENKNNKILIYIGVLFLAALIVFIITKKKKSISINKI